MPDAKLEHWINDFEAKFYTEKARPYTPAEFIYDLRHKSQCLGIHQIKSKTENTEIIYCYIPRNNQGLILKRENDKAGSKASYINYVSYGYISLDDFITNHTHLRPKEESKIKKCALPALISAIIPVTYIGVKKFLEKKKEKE